MKIYPYIKLKSAKGEKLFALLIDPDKVQGASLSRLIRKTKKGGVDLYFVGGSLISNISHESIVQTIKKESNIPVVLFPGNSLQIDPAADALLLLSLISGRNAEMLIGKHVMAAPYIKASKLEVIPTGYMVIESGRPTSVSYISHSHPIPADKDDIAACTALAGEMLGLDLIYLDAGSGAMNPVPTNMIKAVHEAVKIPIVVGGGIRTADQAATACFSGADVVVVGNAIEENESLISVMARAIHNV
ncbi:MAG: geranylgeranylglyceryl/heptaprenylglyceryl phosphate synthase [Bacteroidetes bacterium]|nr:geranylgeranylglyceryl/heptaprenylglyceryl phosphate synthase [Bacteroidota bacterium]